MRMGTDATSDAATLLSTADEVELASIFREYADEHRAMRLAREIVRRRGNRPFVTSDDLVGAIRGALGPRTGPADFARLFQALRIAVNDEIGELTRALAAAEALLAAGGRLAVVSFHSLEDREVKEFLRARSGRAPRGGRHRPEETPSHAPTFRLLQTRPIRPSAGEIAANPRARSARLRAAERTEAGL